MKLFGLKLTNMTDIAVTLQLVKTAVNWVTLGFPLVLTVVLGECLLIDFKGLTRLH